MGLFTGKFQTRILLSLLLAFGGMMSIALLSLPTTGLALYRFGWPLLLALLLIGLTDIILIQYRPLALTALSLFERLPRVPHWTPLARAFYDSAYSLLQWQPLLLARSISIISWTGECVALYFVYQGLGLHPSFTLFIQAMGILAFSSLLGSATGLPGGLGSAASNMLALTRPPISPSSSISGSATLLIRLCTLWLGLLIGASAMLFFHFHRSFTISGTLGIGREETKIRTVLPVENVYTSQYSASSTPTYTGETIV